MHPVGIGEIIKVGPASQAVVAHRMTWAFVLQSTPEGEPHVHAEHARVSCVPL
jgi:hypothetical protein